MDKFKKFVSEHKKAIIGSAIVVGVVGIGAVIAYKLHLNKANAIDAIGDGSEIEDVIVDTINEVITKK